MVHKVHIQAIVYERGSQKFVSWLRTWKGERSDLGVQPGGNQFRKKWNLI